MLAPGDRQRVNHAVLRHRRVAEPGELGIDERNVESGIVGDQPGAVDESQEIPGNRVEGRLEARSDMLMPWIAWASACTMRPAD